MLGMDSINNRSISMPPPPLLKFELPTTPNVSASFVQKCAPSPDVCARKLPALSQKQSEGGH